MDANAEFIYSTEIEKIPALPRITIKWFIFFLIWPFGALLASLRRFREPFAKTIFWLFCVYYGFVFIYEDPALERFGADSARYAQNLIDMHQNNMSFKDLLELFYNPKNGSTDIYQPLITWIVSLISNNPRILFAVFAAVFGFFWSQNLWIIFSRINGKTGIVLLVLIITFVLINPIWNINGVRMWTAGQIFIYGCLIYFLEQKKQGLLWAASSVLVHFSFMFPVALLFSYLLLPRKLWIFFLFFIVASLIREINIKAVREMLSFLPDVFQPKVESYTSEPLVRRVMQSREAMSWHVKFSDIAGRIVIYIWVFITFINRRKWVEENPEILKLFMLALFLGGFAQIASLLPSGGRFISISRSLFYPVFILLFSSLYLNRLSKIIILLTIPLLLFTILFAIRIGFEFTGAFAFFGNPFLSIFINEQTKLIDFVKQLI